jgi:hypothetical protein
MRAIASRRREMLGAVTVGVVETRASGLLTIAPDGHVGLPCKVRGLHSSCDLRARCGATRAAIRLDVRVNVDGHRCERSSG